MREIVLEPAGTDENGVPLYEAAKEKQPKSSIIGLIIAYGLFFFSIALSGA